MVQLVIYEFKKIWNKVTLLAILAMILVLGSYYFIVYGDKINTAIGKNNEVVTGIKVFKELKEESKDIKGVMNQGYLDSLVKNYNLSKEKDLYKNNSNTPYIKYIFPNFFINFVNYGSEMNQYHIDLDFDFLKSEKEFYSKYKETVKKIIKERNQIFGVIKYNDKQMKQIEEKINEIKTPIKVEYEMGLENFVYMYGGKYWIVLVVIAFALSTIFSKNSINGLDELSLSSTLGRKKDMNARVIAGNIFATIVYGIYIGFLFFITGITASLQGWKASAQIFWNLCPYNISFGTGILIMLFMGLLGIIIIANLIMLISINFKNYKVSTGISFFMIFLLLKLTETTSQLQLQLNPIFFSSHFTTSNLADFEIFYFMGEKMIPYSVIVIILFLLYMTIIRTLTYISYKKYALN
ncbi:MAG: hypothetical protein ACRDD2_00360 [Sarcina sp.]